MLVAEEFAPWGRRPPKPKRVQYVSCVFINDPFLSQVEPGDTVATTKEGEYNFYFFLLVLRIYSRLLTSLPRFAIACNDSRKSFVDKSLNALGI